MWHAAATPLASPSPNHHPSLHSSSELTRLKSVKSMANMPPLSPSYCPLPLSFASLLLLNHWSASEEGSYGLLPPWYGTDPGDRKPAVHICCRRGIWMISNHSPTKIASGLTPTFPNVGHPVSSWRQCHGWHAAIIRISCFVISATERVQLKLKE